MVDFYGEQYNNLSSGTWCEIGTRKIQMQPINSDVFICVNQLNPVYQRS